MKTLLQYQLGGNTLLCQRQMFFRRLYTLHQYPICDGVSQMARIHRSRNQGVEEGVHYPLLPSCKIFAFCCHDLMLCWSIGLNSRERNGSTRKHNSGSIELKIETASRQF